MAVSKKQLQLSLLLAHWEQCDLDDMLLGLAMKKKLMLAKRKHRFWVHDIIKKRKKYGAFYHLVKHLELDNANARCMTSGIQ